jgi:hypothetical protein
MSAGTMHAVAVATASTARTTALSIGAMALSLWVGLAAAQPTLKDSPPPRTDGKPGADTEMIVQPPAAVDPQLPRPAPRSKDQGLIETPPADAGRETGNARVPPPGRSRQDDCKGATQDCKQASPR